MHYISQKFIFSQNQSRGCVAALGCFDGVHKGHLSLLKRARETADRLGLRAEVLSFEQPPAFYFSAERRQLLTKCEDRAELFREAGIDSVNFLRFEDVKDMSAGDFVNRILKDEIGAEGIVCGFNFTYGKNRTGSPESLSASFPGRVEVCPAVIVEGEPVSSSRIRRLISEGDVEEASKLLSRPYSLTSVSSRGRHDGTALGFPTANLFPDLNLALPAPGVYVSTVDVEGLGTFPAVSDAGFAPSLDNSGRYRVEAHILDFCRELYGRKIRVNFLTRLRPEIHFDSKEELQAAIASDVAAAKLYFSQNKIN